MLLLLSARRMMSSPHLVLQGTGKDVAVSVSLDGHMIHILLLPEVVLGIRDVPLNDAAAVSRARVLHGFQLLVRD